MAHLPDGPLGPQLLHLGFKRLGTIGERPFMASDLRPTEKYGVEGACAMIALKRRRLPELPIFMRISGMITVTVFVDVKGQIWFTRALVDLRAEMYIDEFVDLD